MNITKIGLKNPVPFNLIMWVIIILGISFAFMLRKEAFPSILEDIVNISVEMETSSTPDQIDSTVNQLIYSQIESVDGIKSIKSTALESAAFITVEIERGYSAAAVKKDIKD